MSMHATEQDLNLFVDDAGSGVDPQVRVHVDGCAACQREVAALAALIAQSVDLDTPIEPPLDLWPGIARRTVERRRRSRVATIAAVMLLIVSATVGGILVVPQLGRDKPPLAFAAIELLHRAELATGDGAFYARRREALTDSLSRHDLESVERDTQVAIRLREVDSLTRSIAADPSNRAHAMALARALDAWFFDVQQALREARRR